MTLLSNGKTLIEHLICILYKRNIHRIYLESSIQNIHAQKLYESLNFHKIGLHKDYYTKGEHAILYYMDLIENG